MNKTELGSSILVKGTAPSGSLVTIYLDDVAITGAVGETAKTGLWTVAIAKSGLGADGVKVMTAKVTEVGLAATAAVAAVTATQSKVDSGVATVTSGDTPITLLADNTSVAGVAGTWTVYCTGDSTVTTGTNVTVTTPAGVATSYLIQNTNLTFGIITGLTTTFDAGFSAGDGCSVVVTSTNGAEATAIPGKATITFDEDVANAAMTAGTYTTIGDPTSYKESTDTGYWTGIATGDAGDTYTITAYGIADLAGNVGGTSSSLLTASCTVGAASLTALAP